MAIGEYRGPFSVHAFGKYAAARFTDRMTEKVYRVYVTDSLRAIPKGEYLTRRYSELFESKQDYDAREVINKVTERAGLEVR